MAGAKSKVEVTPSQSRAPLSQSAMPSYAYVGAMPDDEVKAPAPDWGKIFAACDQAGFEDFLQARDQGEYEKREPLYPEASGVSEVKAEN
jgi:hypothetical protein